MTTPTTTTDLSAPPADPALEAALARFERVYIEGADVRARGVARDLNEVIDEGSTSTWVYPKLAASLAEANEYARELRRVHARLSDATSLADLVAQLDVEIEATHERVLRGARFVDSDDDALNLRVQSKILETLNGFRANVEEA